MSDVKTITLDNIVWELPYWDLLPPLTDPQFAELKEDIKDKGGNVYPVIWAPARTRSGTPRQVIDGGHRLRAVAELRSEGHPVELIDQCFYFAPGEEAKQAALDLNLKRRHLSPEQRAEWVARLRQEGKSTRQIAEDLNLSQSAVARELKKATESTDSVELPAVIIGKDGKERQAQRPAPSPAGEHEAPLPLEVSQDPAFIAESVELAFAKNGPYHPVTLLPSEPSATTAPREAAGSDGAQEAVLFDGESEYRAPQEDELRAEIDRLKSELAQRVEAKKRGVLPATADRDDHNTPEEILAPLRSFAPIALDPCSNPSSTVGAVVVMTIDDDGLRADWVALTPDRGHIFVNPPYDQEALALTHEQARKASAKGRRVSILVPAKVDQDWYQDAIDGGAAAVCFIKGRVRFWADGERQQGAAFASLLIYYGPIAYQWAEAVKGLGACTLLAQRSYDREKGGAQ